MRLSVLFPAAPPTVRRMKCLTLLVLLFAWAVPTHATIVQMDYSYDAANGNFFGSNPTAKAALNAAALDIGNAITGSLGPVTTDVYSGTNGQTTATFDWRFNLTNPTTGIATTVNTFTFAANSATIVAGTRSLAASTLGVGGPAGGGFQLSGSGFESEWVGAVAAAESASNASMRRGGGPVIGTLSGSSTFGATTANYSLRYGAMLGSLSFNSTSTFHYDHTTPVGVGENDFYSVALHEILHAIGFGVSDTWSSLHSGTTWNGSNVITLQGTGANMVSADGGHIADGTMSTRITDGAAQEAVMDPTLTVGSRKTLTQLDLAFLRDLGFSTVPEPSAILLVLAAALPLMLVRRRKMDAAFA